jgi:endoglucanase
VTRPQDSDNDSIAECDMGSYEKEPGLVENVAKLQGITADEVPALSVSGQTIREPTAAGTQAAATARAPRVSLMVFTVRLSKRVSKPVTVRAATLNGTARAGSDFTARRGTLKFRPGQTVKRFVVPVLGDRRKERAETLKVRLADPVGATLLRTIATGRIR